MHHSRSHRKEAASTLTRQRLGVQAGHSVVCRAPTEPASCIASLHRTCFHPLRDDGRHLGVGCPEQLAAVVELEVCVLDASSARAATCIYITHPGTHPSRPHSTKKRSAAKSIMPIMPHLYDVRDCDACNEVSALRNQRKWDWTKSARAVYDTAIAWPHILGGGPVKAGRNTQ